MVPVLVMSPVTVDTMLSLFDVKPLQLMVLVFDTAPVMLTMVLLFPVMLTVPALEMFVAEIEDVPAVKFSIPPAVTT